MQPTDSLACRSTMTKNLSDEMHRNARQALAGLAPNRQGDEPGGLPVGRLLAAFFRGRYLVFGTTLFGALIGLFMAITTSNNYISTGKFLFTSSGAESRSLDPTQAKETSQETIATGAAYILNSDDLLMRVVDKLTPQRILQPYKPGGLGQGHAKELFFKIQRDWNAVDEADMTKEEALKRLQKTIAVKRPQFTDVLIATCNANNPDLAQAILETYMVEAVEWHIEKYDDKTVYDAAQKAYDDSFKAYQLAQRNMREFLERKALVTNFDSTKQAVELDEVAANSRLKKLNDDINIKGQQLKRLETLLQDKDKLPPTIKRKVRQSIATELTTELRSQLAKAHVKLSGLRRRFVNPKAPEIEAQEQLIGDIEASLENMSKIDDKETWVDEVVENKQYTDTDAERSKLERELWGLEAEVKVADQLHKDTDKELKRLNGLLAEYETLRSTMVRAEEEKSASSITWDAAQQKRALGLGKFSVLDSIQAASLPLEKEGPNRGKLLIGGLFVGLFMGLGLIVLRALPDRIVRTRGDLEDIEGLAVIGVMPRLDRTNLRRHSAMREQGW